MTLKSLNNTTVARVDRPVRVLQFGEGNFLRAFVDWLFDVANENGVTDLGVAVMKPRAGMSRVIDTLKSQDGLYHVCLEGVENGRPKKETRLVTVVADAFAPDDQETYEKYILSPDLRFVVSNTTEAGIRYEADDVTTSLPITFPGKVANLLWRRFRHFGGDTTKGLYFICCELIEDNGTKLREYVLRHAEEAGLGDEFAEWVKTACVFVDTLVDRIVSGLPGNLDEVKEELGFDDNLVVKGELYHLWAIGGDGVAKLQKELPLDKAGLHVMFMPSIKEFRDKKVRILNGSHTGMVAMSLLAGCETVMDAFDNADVNTFINSMVEKEVLPMIDGDKEELKTFADGILERFYNPFIRHQLRSIALNSLSKWETRNFVTVKDYWQRAGRLAEYELFTFASLLALYAPGSGFEPQDNEAHVSYIRDHWNDNDLRETVRTIVSDGGIFLEDFEAVVPGFSGKVAEYLGNIRHNGAVPALKGFLSSHR